MINGLYDGDSTNRWLFSDTDKFQQAVHCGTTLTRCFSNVGKANVGPILPHSRADISGPVTL